MKPTPQYFVRLLTDRSAEEVINIIWGLIELRKRFLICQKNTAMRSLLLIHLHSILTSC